MMKRFISTLIVLGILLSVHGQETDLLTNKNGTPILPEEGDLAFGINAASLLSIFKDGGNQPSFDFVQGNTFSMKYFLTDRSAFRGLFRIGSTTQINGNEDLSDYILTRNTDMALGGGYEIRMGSGRLQGFYGGEGGFLFQRDKRTDENDNLSQDEVGLGFFLRVFVGSEYFVAPKLSLGGQFSYGASLLSSVNNETNSATSVVSLDLDNLGGAILLTFHF